MTADKQSAKPVTRRKALKNLGAGAFGVGSFSLEIPTNTIESTASSVDTVRIPTVKSGDTVLKWKEVPRSWYEHTKHSEKVRTALERQYLDNSGVRGIASARWEKRFDGKNGLLVEAEVDPDTYGDSLPDSVEDIPIRVTEAPDVTFSDCCYHNDYDPVPGGVAVTNGMFDPASAGFCVNDSNGNKRLLTANHLWGPCEDNTGGQLNQHTDEFGTVETIDKDTDYALVKPTSAEGIDNQVIVNGIHYTVSGWKTHSGINDLITSGEPCYQTGGTTCTTQGNITG